MSPEEYISGAATLVGKTPIYPCPAEIVKIQDDLDLLAEKCRQPLKVVLMGASNSGKSTLLNALAGDSVSPVDIRETTAVIIRVRYATEHQAKMSFYDKDCHKGSIAEIFNILEQHRNDVDFASSCREVEIAMPLPTLYNLEIVDTPGMGTLTKKNQETAKNYIQQADLILWVLHASYINNETIENDISDAFDFGKPMICAVTHVDEVEATPEQVAEAAEDALPGYFDKIFPLNASEAYQAVCEKSEEKIIETGFQALLKELETEYDNNSEEAQSESLLDSAQNLLIKDRDIHFDAIRIWRERHDAYIRVSEDIKYMCQEIEKKFTNELRNWFENDFFKHEGELLVDEINKISVWSKKDKEEDVKELWNRLFSKQTIEELLSSRINDDNDRLQLAWADEIKNLQDKVNLEYGNLIFNKSINFLPDSQELTTDAELEDSTVTIGKTTVASAVFGGAASAYAAGLGTYAAHLSMAGALGSFMPPVLLAGLIAGLIKHCIDTNTVRKKWQDNVKNAIDDVRKNLKRNLMNGYRGTIQNCNQAYSTAIEKNFLNQAFGLRSIDEVNVRIREIEEHRHLIENYMDEAPSYGDIIDLSRQRMEELIKENYDLKKNSSDGNTLHTVEKMKAKMVEMRKTKLQLEQELDKKEKILEVQRKELEAEKLEKNSSNNIVAQLSKKLERNEREKNKLELERKNLEENYATAQRNMQDLETQYAQLKETLISLQSKAAKLKELGIDLEASDAFEKLEASMHDVTESLIQNEKSRYQDQLKYFKKQYPRYDDNTLKDLATGQLLRKQFLPFKDVPSIDFSPALLPSLVMIERVMRKYYVERDFLKNANKCPWATICNDVKEHEFRWRQGFGDELLALKEVRNQAVHSGNIDYQTYESSYKRIVSDTNSVINFIYVVVTK